MGAAVVVVGLGRELWGDGGAGAAAVRMLAERRAARAHRLLVGVDPVDLLGMWDDTHLAVVIDATCSDADAGTIRVTELSPRAMAAEAAHEFAHGDDLSAVLRLSAALGHAPRRVVLVGIEGQDFGPSRGLTERVAAAAEAASAMVLDLARFLGPHARRRTRGALAGGLRRARA